MGNEVGPSPELTPANPAPQLGMDHDEIDAAFTYHAPKDDQVARYKTLRDVGKAFALTIMAECPLSREKSLALTKVREAVMWANAAIACNE